MAIIGALLELTICIGGGLMFHWPHGHPQSIAVRISAGIAAFSFLAYAFTIPWPRIAGFGVMLLVACLSFPITDRPLNPAFLVYGLTLFVA